MDFQLLIDLISSIQCIKGKYPMVVSYFKHLQKCQGNFELECKEVNRFITWVRANPELPKITDPFLHSKVVICFTNVYALASPEVIEQFEQKLMDIVHTLPEAPPAASEEEITPGVANAMAEIQKNPVFSDLIDNIKATVADTDIQNDPGSVLENENFQALLKNIQGGLKSGKFKLSDLTSTIHSVIGSVQDELDPETREVITSAVGMMSEAEQGHQPNIGKVVDLLKNLNFNK